MADFAPNFTARYRVHYSQGGKSHSMLWRLVNTETDPTSLAAKVSLFLADLQDYLYTDWTVVSADFAPADSDVFLPAVAPDQPTAGFSLSSFHPTDVAVSVGFVGRSDAGGKARMFLYGTFLAQTVRADVGDDFRITSAEDATISAAITRLNETSPALVANDNHVAVWYSYVNLKYNDRWLRRLRRG